MNGSEWEYEPEELGWAGVPCEPFRLVVGVFLRRSSRQVIAVSVGNVGSISAKCAQNSCIQYANSTFCVTLTCVLRHLHLILPPIYRRRDRI